MRPPAGRTRWITILAMAFWLVGAGAWSLTGRGPSLARSAGGAGTRTAVSKRPRGKHGSRPERNLHMNEVEIYGEVEKPKTMFVIPRAFHGYSRMPWKKDFTDEILQPINKQWVEDRQRWREDVPSP